jgi:hypothetical protein
VKVAGSKLQGIAARDGGHNRIDSEVGQAHPNHVRVHNRLTDFVEVDGPHMQGLVNVANQVGDQPQCFLLIEDRWTARGCLAAQNADGVLQDLDNVIAGRTCRSGPVPRRGIRMNGYEVGAGS